MELQKARQELTWRYGRRICKSALRPSSFMGRQLLYNSYGTAFVVFDSPAVEMKKRAHIGWTDKHKTAVKGLTHAFINRTKLQTADLCKPFVLQTDASGYAIGLSWRRKDDQLDFEVPRCHPQNSVIQCMTDIYYVL